MSNASRFGLWICLAGLTFMLIQAIDVAISLSVSNARWQDGKMTWESLTILCLTTLGVCSLGSALWKGWSGARWVGLVALLSLGMCLIWFAYWQATRDIPSSIGPLERAKMQDEARGNWQWLVVKGALNLLTGAFLLLPPVRQFLGARREFIAKKQVQSPVGQHASNPISI